MQTGEVVHSLPSKKQKAIDDMTYYVLENGQGMANYESSKAQQKAHILQLAYVTFIVGIGLSIPSSHHHAPLGGVCLHLHLAKKSTLRTHYRFRV